MSIWSDRIYPFVAALGAVVIVAGFCAYIYTASANDYPPTGNGGSPTAATPTPDIPEETAQPTIDEDLNEIESVEVLPSTGAGTTAHAKRTSNHTGWHTGQHWCDSGYGFTVQYYQYYNWRYGWHSEPTQVRFVNMGYCNTH